MAALELLAVAVLFSVIAVSYLAIDARNTLPGVVSFSSDALTHVVSLVVSQLDTHKPADPGVKESSRPVDVDAAVIVWSLSIAVLEPGGTAVPTNTTDRLVSPEHVTTHVAVVPLGTSSHAIAVGFGDEADATKLAGTPPMVTLLIVLEAPPKPRTATATHTILAAAAAPIAASVYVSVVSVLVLLCGVAVSVITTGGPAPPIIICNAAAAGYITDNPSSLSRRWFRRCRCACRIAIRWC